MKDSRYYDWWEATPGVILLRLCSKSLGPIKLCGRVLVGTGGFAASVPSRESPNWTRLDDWKELAWVPTLKGAKRKVTQEVQRLMDDKIAGYF